MIYTLAVCFIGNIYFDTKNKTLEKSWKATNVDKIVSVLLSRNKHIQQVRVFDSVRLKISVLPHALFLSPNLSFSLSTHTDIFIKKITFGPSVGPFNMHWL